MKRTVIFSMLLCAFFMANAQEKQQITKTGWNFGGLPTITFDSDLGFQYGAMVNVYHYGDGSRFPKYNHSLYFEVSRFTKGSGINRFFYDSDKLIEGLQTSLDLSYLSDQAYDFFGFNGYDAVYQPDWIDQEASAYKTRMYYKYDRKLFRAKLDLQGKLAGNFRWTTGFNFQNFKVDEIDRDKFNKGKDENDKDYLKPIDGLYTIYKNLGIINTEEKDGGFVPTFKAGLVFDTRDNRPNPMKGVWTEAVIEVAPKILGAESYFTRATFIHRQYFTIVPKDLSLVYRLAYQTTLGGDVPFFYKSQVMTSFMTGALSEGLGGGKTVRGILRNRVIGDGFFYGNLEARWKFVHFQFIKNNFYLGLNGFMDFGRITKKVEIPSSIIAANPLLFKSDAEKFHTTYGAGLRIVMNENFVIAVDYGRAMDEQDGKSGMYIGLNYLF
ncbi:MAG TPA: BamA/TamA family outer membrane protein [Prolixibacteraceae bacterium]|nr:BamA/TamA family outer membrane protein [Prolixibacteraceae bacterium]